MSRFSSFYFVCCFFAVLYLNSAKDVVGIIENTDEIVWNTVDALCHDTEDLIDKTVGSPNTLHLRLVEYTTFGMQSYSVFPSAAAPLMNSKHFDPKKKTVIFVHGFTDNPASFSGQSFAAAYKVHGHHNVLALDSSKLIRMFYLRSSDLVKYIGETLGVIVHDLVNRGVPVENIHLVGHSLGAHIAGFAGKAYQMLSPGKKLPRITGMDPAGPCFFRSDSDHRLDKEDAEFVDVIHTNVGVFGLNKTIGHVDFYPNAGGPQQPGCLQSICSHSRVWQLYEESVVRPNAFMATECDSWEDFNKNMCDHNEKVIMGMNTPSSARGVFYLRTNFMSPFGFGMIGAKPSIFRSEFLRRHEE